MRRWLVALAGLALVVSLLTPVALASVRPALGGDGLLIVLVIGSDTGLPERPGDPLHGRADAIHLLAVNPAGASATVVDLPRDSLVEGDKLNAFLVTGGPEGLVARVEALAGIDVDHWVLTTFQGLTRLVDAAGGVEVNVDVPMHDAFSGSNLEPGTQRLNGGQALAFARDRHSMPDGDLGRSRHQGDLLLAAHRDLRGRSLTDLVRLTAALARSSTSDIPPTQLFPLALEAARIPPEAVRHQPLGGPSETVNGESIVRLNPADAFTRLQQGLTGP